MAETERLLETSEIFIINGTERSIDIYVNFETQPSLSDPAALTVGDVFVVDGSFERPFDTYTFEARRKGDEGGPVLASSSVPMTLGQSYSGIFHEMPNGDYQFSIYENDLSNGAAARLTVRNTCHKQPVTWSLKPNGQKPEEPRDERRGALMSAEWQIARDVQPNSYDFRVMRNDQVIAREPNLEIGLEQNLICHVVGNPEPNLSQERLRQALVIQELEYDPGAAVGDVTSDSRPPFSMADDNAGVVIEVDDIEVFETLPTGTTVTAYDPDGTVLSLEVMRVDPDNGGIEITDNSFAASSGIGEPASAKLSVKSDLPPGNYDVRIAANRETLAQTAFTTMRVTVKPITPDRLADRVREFEGAGSIEPQTADDLVALTRSIEDAVNADEIARACDEATAFLDILSDQKDITVDAAASDALTRETKALQNNFGC